LELNVDGPASAVVDTVDLSRERISGIVRLFAGSSYSLLQDWTTEMRSAATNLIPFRSLLVFLDLFPSLTLLILHPLAIRLREQISFACLKK
jgi:hypothetical protein